MNFYVKKQNFLWQKMLMWGGAVVASLIFLNVFQVQARDSFFFVSRPISKVFIEGGKNTTDFFSSFFAFNVLKKENTHLKTENQSLLASLSQLQERISSWQDLQTALQNTQQDNFTLLQSSVLGLDIENDTMLIEGGQDNGVLENMPVISKEKVLFGRITKVYANFSQVVLISSARSALAVKIQNTDTTQTSIYGIVKGSGALSVYMDLITTDSQISEGNVLITSSQEGIFPKDLLVGKIETLNSNDARAFKSAKVQPFFDPKHTSSVFVITNHLKK